MTAHMAQLIPKAEVAYTDDHGTSDEQCSKCEHYCNPTTCDIVAGIIRPTGWCKRFKRD